MPTNTYTVPRQDHCKLKAQLWKLATADEVFDALMNSKRLAAALVDVEVEPVIVAECARFIEGGRDVN